MDQKVVALYNRLTEGERLTPAQRDEFVKTSNQLFASQADKQKQLEETYGGIAERLDINRDDVVIDFIGEQPEEKKIVKFNALGQRI